MRILVVEDDEVLREGLDAGLSLEGHTVDLVETCMDAREAAASYSYDALVVDIGLPDGSGLDLVHDLRRSGNTTPILVLTARTMAEDRIEGLDRGADDYLGKPFDLGELAARLRALVRRANGRTEPSVTIGPLAITLATRQVTLKGQEIELSRCEFAVLEVLVRHPGHVISRSQIEEAIYGWQEEVGSNAVEVHIHKLRGKLGTNFIETVRGVGYRVREQ